MKKITLLLCLSFSSFAFSAQFGVERIKENVVDLKNESFEIQADFYRPINQKIIATLILFPTISGVSPIETITAKYFAKRGFVVIVPMPFKTEINKAQPETQRLDIEYDSSSIAAMKLLNISDKKFKLDSKMPVFALGASQGGIRTVALSAYTERIKAAWFAVAGGDFPYIYAYSDVKGIAEFRQKQMTALKIKNAKDYEQYLRQELTQDPLISCSQITIPIVQVIALKDSKVPTKTQLELEKSCPPHKTYRLKSGHLVGIASIVAMKSRIKDFFLSHIEKN
jgi:hypothetical protein